MSFRGKKHTEETKRKISLKKKGNNHGFKKRNELWNNPDSISTRFKKGQSVSPETQFKKGRKSWLKGKSHLVIKGDKNPSWKGGITSLNKAIRSSFKYRQWRSDVFMRDNFICQRCDARGNYLHSHHIKSISEIIEEYELKSIEDALNCEELWNINNGKTLCIDCHSETISYKGKNNKRHLIIKSYE